MPDGGGGGGGGGGGVHALPRGPSYSSSSKGSRTSRISSARHHYSVSDGVTSYASSPSESFNGHGEFPTMPESRSGSSLQSSKEGFPVNGASAHHCSADSSSSHSDVGDCERNAVIHFPPVHKGFSGRYSFMSKAVYPMPFPAQFSEIDGPVVDSVSSSSRFASTEWRNSFRWPDNSVHHEPKSSGSFPEFSYMQSFPEPIASSQRERVGWTTTNSPDFGWDTENSKYKNPLFGSGLSTSEGLKCGLCERWLSQKSPWSSHRMIRSGDFPPSGVLSCGHVYHADCLEQTIPDSQKHDPPCPLCAGALNTASTSNSELPQAMSAARFRIPRFKIATDDNSLNSSGKHSYIHSDYVADISGKKWHMQMPGCSKKSFLSRTLTRKHFFKGKSVKELPTEDSGSKKGNASIHFYHDNKSTDNIRASCSRG